MTIAEQIENLTNVDTFYDDVRKIVGYDHNVFWEDWQIKGFQRIADARYRELTKKRQLQIGDTIICQGIKATIKEIAIQEPWEWRGAWYIEFKDTNDIYRSWKQLDDGGYAIDEKGERI